MLFVGEADCNPVVGERPQFLDHIAMNGPHPMRIAGMDLEASSSYVKRRFGSAALAALIDRMMRPGPALNICLEVSVQFIDAKRRNVNRVAARTWRERPWDFWRASWDFDAFSFPYMPFRLLER
jgi:hypothetical protein